LPYFSFTISIEVWPRIYAVAIILPIVGTFFLAFALLEDSGYLPRLAYLLDRACKHLGLSGRAVITGIAVTDERLVRKLTAMGLLPDTEVMIVRNRPAVVLRLDRTELAVGRPGSKAEDELPRHVRGVAPL